MKVSAAGGLGAGVVLVVVGTIATAELSTMYVAPALRWPVYAGSGAGLLIGAAGLPFTLALARLPASAGLGFWRWWAAGVLARGFLLLALAALLVVTFREHPTAALLSLAAVYLAGMFGEAAWLATIFCRSEP